MARVSTQKSMDQRKQRLYARQRLLLGLLNAIGGNASNTDFQKLLFLYCKEPSLAHPTDTAKGLYDFVPYRYGAFSFTSYADRRRLVDWGCLRMTTSSGFSQKTEGTSRENPETARFVRSLIAIAACEGMR